MFVALSPILISALKRNTKVTICITYLAYGMFYLSESVPFGTWRAITNTLINLEGLSYFLIGMMIALFNNRNGIQKFSLPLVLVAFAFTIIRVYCKSVGHEFLYNHTRFLVVPGFLWLLWKIMPTSRWPKWLTSSAFAIYLIHPFAIFIFKTMLHTQIENLSQYIMCIAVSIFVPVLLKFGFSTISRPIALVAFGGRI